MPVKNKLGLLSFFSVSYQCEFNELSFQWPQLLDLNENWEGTVMHLWSIFTVKSG